MKAKTFDLSDGERRWLMNSGNRSVVIRRNFVGDVSPLEEISRMWAEHREYLKHVGPGESTGAERLVRKEKELIPENPYGKRDDILALAGRLWQVTHQFIEKEGDRWEWVIALDPIVVDE